MTDNVVARRYARALFALGLKKGLPELEKLAKDLNSLKAMLESSTLLCSLYKNPLFSTLEKYKVTEELLKTLGASADTYKFCQLLAEKKRLVSLPFIADFFNSFLDAEKGIVRGELVTAVELDENKRKQVLEQLEGQVKHALALTYAVEPSLLGGVLLKVGDQVLDASLRAQLSILKDNIKRGE